MKQLNFLGLTVSFGIQDGSKKEAPNAPTITTKRFGASVSGIGSNRFDFNMFFQMWRKQPDIYACIREWANFTGKQGYRFINKNDPEQDPNPAAVENMNAVMNFREPFRMLLRGIVEDLGRCDNAFVTILKNEAGQIIGLQKADPRTVSIISDDSGNVFFYVQRSLTSGETRVWNENEMIHFRFSVDPDNELWGMSPMRSIFLEAQTDLEAQNMNFGILKNQGTPTVQYIIDPELTTDQKKEVVEQLKKEFGGSGNAGKSGVIDGIIEIKVTGLSPKEMEYLLGRKFSTDKICAAYDVPTFLLGYTDKVNNNNGTELTQNFYDGTIQPMEEAIADFINRRLIQVTQYSDILTFEFKPQVYNQNKIIDTALKEVDSGTISRRQYKMKTGQDIEESDEQQENFDKLVLGKGASAVLLEDVGIDPVDLDDQAAREEINKIVNENSDKQANKQD